MNLPGAGLRLRDHAPARSSPATTARPPARPCRRPAWRRHERLHRIVVELVEPRHGCRTRSSSSSSACSRRPALPRPAWPRSSRRRRRCSRPRWSARAPTCSRCAISRAVVSVAPPAGKPTTSLIGFWGTAARVPCADRAQSPSDGRNESGGQNHHGLLRQDRCCFLFAIITPCRGTAAAVTAACMQRQIPTSRRAPFTVWTFTARVALGLKSVDSWAVVNGGVVAASRRCPSKLSEACLLRLVFKRLGAREANRRAPGMRRTGAIGYAGHDPDLRRGP